MRNVMARWLLALLAAAALLVACEAGADGDSEDSAGEPPRIGYRADLAEYLAGGTPEDHTLAIAGD